MEGDFQALKPQTGADEAAEIEVPHPPAGDDSDEEEDMVEYVLMDLGSELHGAELTPGSGYTLKGLDTENPILELDNGLRLVGHYEETIGSYLILREESREDAMEDDECGPATVSGSEAPPRQAGVEGSLSVESDAEIPGGASSSVEPEPSSNDANPNPLASASDTSIVNRGENRGPVNGEHEQVLRMGFVDRSTSIGHFALRVASMDEGVKEGEAKAKSKARCEVQYLCATRKRLKFQRVI